MDARADRASSGCTAAADTAVHDLGQRFGLDLWLVTTVDVDSDTQTVVSSAGPWVGQAPPGVVRSAERAARDAARAQALASRDALTGLLDRRGWQDALSIEEPRCWGYGSAASVLALDLDDLEQVDDRSGHSAGDHLLRRCGTVLTDTCRPGDVLARLGGDEFGILAVECDVVSARALTARLRLRLRVGDVAASLGAATRRQGEPLGQTWQRADEAMYRAKRSRRASATRRSERRRQPTAMRNQPDGALVRPMEEDVWRSSTWQSACAGSSRAASSWTSSRLS